MPGTRAPSQTCDYTAIGYPPEADKGKDVKDRAGSACLCGGVRRGALRPEESMQDISFLVVTIVFFLVSIAYVYACERLQ